MDEDIDRRVRLAGAVDVELLDLGRAVGDARGRADGGARLLAVGDPALGDLLAIGCVDNLIIGVVERLLVHVEPNERTLRARLRAQGSARGDCCARGHERAAGNIVIMCHAHAAFVIVPPVELSTTTGLSNQVIVGFVPYSFSTRSRHSAL